MFAVKAQANERNLCTCASTEPSDTADVDVPSHDLMAKPLDDGRDGFESLVLFVRNQHLQAMFRLGRHHASPMAFGDPTLEV